MKSEHQPKTEDQSDEIDFEQQFSTIPGIRSVQLIARIVTDLANLASSHLNRILLIHDNSKPQT